MRDIIIMGVDPGIWSLGMCAMKNGRFTSTFQDVTRPKDKVKDGSDCDKWFGEFVGMLDRVNPTVVAIEDYEPQAWKSAGRIPKGSTKMANQIRKMREHAQLRGFRVYIQSPSIQSEYDAFVIEQLLRKGMGNEVKITPHLISACKHAMYADSMYRRSDHGR